MATPSWLTVTQGTAPLLVSIPHTGIDLAGLDSRLVSTWTNSMTLPPISARPSCILPSLAPS